MPTLQEMQNMREALNRVNNGAVLMRLRSGSCTKQDYENIGTVLEDHDRAISDLERIYEILYPTPVT